MLKIKNYKHKKSKVEGGIIKPEPGIYQGITNEMYHNWPEFDALSAGGLKTLIKSSPLHFVTAQANMGTASDAMNFGSAAHSFILEPELDEVVEMPKFDRRSKAGKAEYEAFHAENGEKIIVTAEEMTHLEGMREMFMRHETARALLEGSRKELSVFWKHFQYEFQCKCRPDICYPDFLGSENILADYKTTRDASPAAFGKDFVNLHYHIQAYWYRQGMEQLTNLDWEFIYIAQEKTPPYGVACYYVPGDAYLIAHQELKIATEVYNECLYSNKWPCYPDEYSTLKIPQWAKKTSSRNKKSIEFLNKGERSCN